MKSVHAAPGKFVCDRLSGAGLIVPEFRAGFTRSPFKFIRLDDIWLNALNLHNLHDWMPFVPHSGESAPGPGRPAFTRTINNAAGGACGRKRYSVSARTEAGTSTTCFCRAFPFFSGNNA